MTTWMLLSRKLCTAVCCVTLSTVACGCDGDSNRDKPPATAAPAQSKPAPATQPLIPSAQMIDWCREHAMPESICVQCSPDLAASFKSKGDWDEQHGLPKSQCFQCDPSLKDKFAAAYRAKYGKEPPTN